MLYRTLGRTGLDVSLLSYGTGGPRLFGQRTEMQLSEQKTLIRRCLDLGINLFDTAEKYGQSEGILGECFDGVPRDSYHVITKWNMDDDGTATKGPEDLSNAIDRSLRLLRTDYIDVFMFHGLTDANHDEAVEVYHPLFQLLQSEGKIRSIGLSTFFMHDPAQIGALKALQLNPDLWDVIMIKYGILNQHAANEILPLAQKHNVGVVNMAAARVRLPDPKLLAETVTEWKAKGYFAADSLSNKDPLGWLVHDDVESVVAAGYKFAAEHPAISTVLTGTASLDHLEENARALENPRLAEVDTRRLVEVFGDIVEYA